MICENCNRDIEPLVYKGYNAAGMKQVVKKCPECDRNVKKNQAFYSYKDYDFDNLPTLYDATLTAHPCEVRGCERKGTQLHHFFPRFLFPYADQAPQAYLCLFHHMQEWHAKLTPNMSKKDLD